MSENKFSFKSRIKSFGHAFNGLKTLLMEEHNARIHFAAALTVVIAGVVFRVTPAEWTALIIVIGLVIALEIINTLVERIADFVSPDRDHRIKKIKDLSAAGVFIGALTALITGLIIFIPKIF